MQQFHALADGAKSHPFMGYTLDQALVGLVLDGEDEDLPPRVPARLQETRRQLATTGDNAELRRHVPLWVGRRRARNRFG